MSNLSHIPSQEPEGIPLSPQQRRLWLLQRQGGACLAQCSIQITGGLSKRRLRDALNRLVGFHQILRTAFRSMPGFRIPSQVILDFCPPSWREMDLSGFDKAQQKVEADSLIRLERSSPFDLQQGPFLRSALLRLAEERHLLVLTLPSLCADAWTLRNLAEEIASRYADGFQEQDPDETLHYAQFSEWQNALAEEEDATEGEVFWRQHDCSSLCKVPIPFESRGESWQSAEFDWIAVPLDAQTGEQIESAAAESGVSAQVFLAACWQALFWRMTGRTEMAAGLASDGREHEMLVAAVGLFARWLPLRLNFSNQTRLQDLLHQADESWREACEWQDYFRLEDPQGGEDVPCFSLGFEALDQPEALSVDGVKLSLLRHGSPYERFDLKLVFMRGGAGPALELHFDAARFAREDVKRLSGQLLALLANALAQPDAPLGELQALGEPERRWLLEECNATGQDFGSGCVHELFAAQASRVPHRLAASFEERWLSYGALERMAGQIAASLRTAGAGSGSVVAILSERSLEAVSAMWGTLKAGCAYLPLNALQPPEGMRLVLEDARPAALLTQSGMRGRLPEWPIPTLALEGPWPVEGGDAMSRRPPSPQDAAYLIFTSGSTGRPKGVVIEHRQIRNYALGVLSRLELAEGSSFALVSTLAADLGNTCIYGALCSGGRLELASEGQAADPAALTRLFARRRPDCLKIVPSHLASLQTGAPDGALLPQRCLVVGGEASRWEWAEGMLELAPHCRVVNHYGPTEATVGVLTYEVEGSAHRRRGSLPLGRPLPNSRTYVLDAALRPVPSWCTGELCIGGAGVSRGYLGRPGLTAERFLPDPFAEAGGRLYRTGDLARPVPQGGLEFLGRIDRQVKLRGFRIELGEVESVLAQHPGVREAVAMVRQDQPGDQRLTAYAVALQASPEEAGRRHTLPNGMTVAHQNKNETEYLYQEIYGRRCYLQHGIELPEGAVVFDIGANIGMFTLFVSQHCPGVQLHSFEPLPPIFETLRENVESYGLPVKLYPMGVSDREREVEFTYYRRHSMMSGQTDYADPQLEAEVVKQSMRNAQASGAPGMESLLELADELLEGRFEGERHSCRLGRLSDVIRQEGIERIDLLKVDCQRAELDVLRGIEEQDWSKIDQIVMEVHDAPGLATEGRLGKIIALLQEKGFEAFAEQDELLAGTDRHNLYAIRRGRRLRAVSKLAQAPPLVPVQPVSGPSTRELREHLREKLPEYMVPSAVVLLDALPLTPNGKLDFKALPPPEIEESLQEYRAPESPTQELLAGIWSDVLGIGRVGLDDHFFELGGHSLLATQVLSRIRQAFSVELALRTIFDAPALGDLARSIDQVRMAERMGAAPPLKPAPRQGDLPLSFAQQRLWFLDQLEPGNSVYNIPAFLRVKGTLNVNALAASLGWILRRHEVLRSRFPARQGKARQEILQRMRLPLPVIELQACPGEQIETELKRLTVEESRRPFDLSAGPLLRTSLVRLASDDHALLASMHHIVSDGWSSALLVRELSSLYEWQTRPGTAGQQQCPPLPELPVQYADFAIWQRDWLSGPALQRQLDYWKERLQGAAALLQLPADRPRPAAQSYRGAKEILRLPAQLLESLKALSHSQDATLFMTLLAAFQVLLCRFSGQEDLSVGTPIANRNRAETERLIGFFVNTLVLRSDLSADPSFVQLLKQVRQTALGAYDHQDVPFEQLVEALHPQRSLSYAPLFQVMLVLQNAPLQQIDLPGLQVLPSMTSQAAPSKFDLTLTFTEHSDSLEAEIVYSLDLFDAESIQRLLTQLQRLLEGAVADPQQRIWRLPLLSGPEREQILTEWNEAHQGEPESLSLQQLFQASVERAPDNPALLFEEETLSYRELNQRANLLARHLRRQGVRGDQVVGLCLERSPQMMIGLLAVLKAGGAYLPLDPSYPGPRLAQMLDESQVSLLLAHERLTPALPDLPATRLLLLEEALSASSLHDLHNPPAGAEGENLALVIYTSGSTGKPKGSMISQRSISIHLDWMQHEFQFQADDRVLQNAPFSFDGSVWEIFCPLLAGACLVLARPGEHKDPAYLVEAVGGSRITTLHAVPSMLQVLLEQEGFSECSSLQRVMCGGEVLPAELQRRFFVRFGEVALYNLYGPTEATVHSTFWRCQADQERRSVPIGRPSGRTQIYLLDRHLEPVPVGAAGELYIGGDGLARGYLARPAQTAARFIPDPFSRHKGVRLYRSGDLARHRADGLIDFLGRADFQVKLRGFRIELGEVEAVLLEHPQVVKAVVLVRQDVPGQKRLTAYVVACHNSGQAVTVSGLREFLAQRLPDFMLPSAFVLLDSIPLTPSGKMDRRALPAPETSRLSHQDLVAPRTEAEATLAGIWSEVLGLSQVGVEDNFFELGGDSILSIQIVAKANQAGLGITVKQAFQHQTIAELAAVAGTSAPVQAPQGLVEGEVPLTPAQHRFFELGLLAPQHWNQHVLLQARQGLSPQALEEALHVLSRHHDALRLRFEPAADGSGWRQFNAGAEQPEAFCRLDLSALSAAQLGNALTTACAQLQASLDLSAGPLMRAGCFEMGGERPVVLLLAIHHLAVDGVSWRILLEDLQSACLQVSSGQPPRLPAKTSSFKEWSERLSRHARSDNLAKEVDYWLEQIGDKALSLPLDFAQGINSEASTASVSLSLSEEETRQLLQEVPWAYRTQINDVLLTALAQSLAGWVGAGKLLADMEGHGREAIFADLDASRTAGWFTSVFPVALQVRQASGLGKALQEVKEQLRLIPNRGLGYGLLRHLKRDPALTGLPQAEVSFNYLGQFDQALPETALFKLADQSGGPARHPLSPRRYLLNVGGGVSGGRLRIDWTYSQAVHNRSTIVGQARRFMKALRSLIDHCRSLGTQHSTPSDFPLARLSQQQLDQVAGGGRAVEDLYPLAPIQQGLLFHSLYHPELSEYVNQLTCRLESRLDAEALQKAWQEVVRKHPVLRTAFFWEGLKEPLQIVYQQAELPWDRRDWRGLAPIEQSRRLEELLEADRRQGFELSQAPLMRLGLIRLAGEAHQFILSFHHLVLDGWSLSLILKEVFTLYDAYREGHEPSLPPTRPYHDYIAWLLNQDLDQAETFWRRTLQGFEGPTPLPLLKSDASEAADQGDVYGWCEMRLAETASADLQTLARRRKLTLNTLMQGAWACLLSRCSQEEDIVFGVTLSGRPAELEGFQSMVGLFINTLPLRLQVPGHRLLPDWLAEVQQRQTEMRHYEYSPLAEVQKWSRAPVGQPLFESILVFENYPVDDSLSESGLSLGIGQVRSLARTNYPLTLTVSPGRQVVARLTYDSRRFDSTSMQRMLGHLENILEAIAAEPQACLRDLPLLSPAERQQLMAEWNDSQADWLLDDSCLHQLFESQAQKFPQAVALDFKSSLVSYGELNRRAERLASRLQSSGVGAESRVGLCLERGIGMIEGLLAVLKAGGAYVPLDPSYPSERLSFMIEDAGVQALLSQESLAQRLPGHSVRLLSLEGQAGFEAEASRPVSRVQPENAAYVIYTSGSTGIPKGVVVEHRAIAHFTRMWIREFGLGRADRLLQFSSISFDQAGEEIYPCLACGGRLLVRDEEMLGSAAAFLDECRRASLTMLDLPTAYWHQICSEMALGQSRLPQSLRVVMIGGEAPLPDRVETWREQAGDATQLINGYGPTEATIASSVFRVPRSGNGDSRQVPIGRPLPNIEVRLMDPALRAVPAGIPGELLIGGANLARGYLGRPALTAQRFVPDPDSTQPGRRLYRSGDLAALQPQGNIQFLGRIDHQVKVRGFRVELGEIEAALSNHPDLAQCAVLARQDAGGEKRLAAYVAFKFRQPTDAEAGADPAGSLQRQRLSGLRGYLEQRLPEHMIPSVFVPLQSLPMTASGKVDRQALLAEDVEAPAQEWAPPRTPAQELLAGIWASVLGVRKPGLNDNFFELGGHSLLATQASSRIRRAFQVELPLRALFEAPTLESLAQRVEDARRSGEAPLQPPLTATSRVADLPLSFAQQRLWFLDQLDPHSALYNIPAALRLRGRLNIPALKAALDALVQRHESLRTRFPAVQGKPLQVIEAQGQIDLPLIDLSSCPEVRQQLEVQRLARQQARRPFDLGQGPLLDVQLVRLDEQEHALLATLHHIVSDGWSMGLLINEITSLYDAFSSRRPSPLPDLPLQYADFAHWQRRWLQGAVLEEQIGYWKETLADAPAALALPFDRPRPAQQSRRGAKQIFRCPPWISQKLKVLSRQEDSTLFMALVAAFQTLLFRCSGQQDIVVGTPIANRNQAETEPLIGFFANTLALRSGFQGEPGFRQLLSRTREAALGAFAHQDVPFEQVVEALQPERSLSRTPLFQVMFALQNAPAAKLHLRGLKVSTAEVETGLSRFDLTLSMVEGDQGLEGTVAYSSELFDSATIRRLLGHFQNLLKSLVSAPEQSVALLPILSPGEEQQLLREWNSSAQESLGDETIHGVFAGQLTARPDAVALTAGDESLSYAEADRRAGLIANFLRSQGVAADVLVGLFMERWHHPVVAMLGILKAGGAYLPLDPAYPQERLSFMLADAGAPVVLTQASLRERLAEDGPRIVCIDQDWASISSAPQRPPQQVGPRNLAYVIYTSGSTGQPKGVWVSHCNLTRLFESTRRWFHFGPDDVWTFFHSTAFDFSVWEIWGALLYGGRVVAAPYWVSRSPDEFHALLRRERVSVLNQTPSAFRQLIQADQSLGNDARLALRLVIFGGEALDLQSLRPWFEKHGQSRPQLVNMFGITETTVHVTYRPLSRADAERPRGSLVGTPIPDLEVRVLDRHLQPVPLGVPGEICIGGAGLSRGYLGRAALTAQKFIADPFGQTPGARLYRSGDLARLLPDRDIEYLGRIDHQVKIRGFRIELGEIESLLGAHPGVGDCTVLIEAHDEGQKRLAAYFTAKADAKAPSASELRDFLRERLPEYMVPSAFSRLEEMPLTAHGKVDRKALPKQAVPEPQSERQRARTPTEELLSAIWSDVLDLEEAGPQDNFFDLGGHSLLATQVVSRIRRAFGTEMALRDLFEAPTLTALAAKIDQALFAKQASSAPALAPAGREQHLPLSFAQQRLWFLDQLEPASAAYNIPSAFRLRGSLNVAALEAALNQVVRRHEALRTCFPSIGGKPVQKLVPHLRLTLSVADLRSLPSLLAEDELRRMARREAQRCFDLAAGPLLRAQLVRLGDQDQTLLLTMHHIVSDGWSTGILVRELTSLYALLASDGGAAEIDSRLPELPVQYADFALWQRQWLSGPVLQGQIDYWRQRLQDASTLLELPADHPRPAQSSNRGGRISFQWPAWLGQALKALGRSRDATPFMTLLTAFQALLHRLSGQSDISVGSPIANRNRAETEGLIGFFVNTLVLRSDFSGHPSFGLALEQVRRNCLGAYEHQDVPFEQLVETLQPQRSLNHAPLFQVMFIYQNAPLQQPQLPGLEITPLAGGAAPSKFDLTLSMAEGRQGLAGTLEYSLDLFEPSTAKRLLRHFRRLAQAVAEDPGLPVADLQLLDAGERHQIVVEWNADRTRSTEDGCFHQLFESQAARTPDRTAAVCGGQSLSYRQLDRRAKRLAGRLRRLGVEPEVRVGFFLPRSLEMVIGLLAIHKAGGAYVPLDPSYPKQRLEYMLRDCQAPLVVSQQDLVSRLPESPARPCCWDQGDGTPHEDGPATPIAPSAQNLAYVIYTSGSTGRPKGVEISHQALSHYLHWCIRSYFNAAGLGVPVHSSLGFDLTVTALMSPLCVGERVILMPEEEALEGLVERFTQPDAFSLVKLTPSHLRLLQESGAPLAQQSGMMIVGGEALTAADLRELKAVTPETRVCNEYGPTEATVGCCVHIFALGQATEGSVPIGRPIPGVSIHLLDGGLHPVPIGVSGELCIAGAGLARGYQAAPHLTAGSFAPDPFSVQPGGRMYRTGDLARRRWDGVIEFLGRIDQQVKIRGFRIELGEIESCLQEHSWVDQAAVLEKEGRLVAFVAGGGGERAEGRNRRERRGRAQRGAEKSSQRTPRSSRSSHLDSASSAVQSPDLRSHLETRLPDYMLPTQIVLLQQLPLTPNGKLDRKALLEAASQQAPQGSIAPRTPTEQLLAGIWADLLEVESVGALDHFFERGGHSLLATQVVSRIRGAFSVELPLRNLFEAPRLEQLAGRIDEARLSKERSPAQPPIERQRRRDDLPLSFAQQRMWFLDQIEPQSSLYNVPVAVRLKGRLNLPALQASLEAICQRHEVLRSSFPALDGKPRLQLSRRFRFPLPVVDLSRVEDARREKELSGLARLQAQRPFDLAAGPLLRAQLVRLDEDEQALLAAMHHIVSDAWSTQVLVRELSALYESFASGRPSPLAELPIQYADFAHWQRRWLSGAVLQEQIDYWTGCLQGAPALDLPSDHPRPALPSRQGASHSFELSDELGQSLKAVSLRSDSTLFMTLLAAFQTLLHRYSGQQDISLGTLVANRNRAESEGLIGFFVNTLVLRTDLSGEVTFRQLLKRVREVALQAYAHQDIPFEQVVDALQPERSLSRTPLFQAMFSYQDLGMPELKMPGIEIEPLQTESPLSRFDLSLSIAQDEQGLIGSLAYAAELFDACTMQRMARHLRTLLKGIAADPDQPIGTLPVLEEAEGQQLLREWNSNPIDWPLQPSLHGLFETQAAQSPDRVAADFGQGQLTYGQLNQSANRLARSLQASGVRCESLVGICLERSIELVAAALAVLKADAAFLPLDPDDPPQRLAWIMQDAGAKQLISDSRVAASEQEGVARLEIDRQWPALGGQSGENLPSPCGSDHLAYCIFTSGSTGRPKGTLIAHQGICNHLLWMQRLHRLEESDHLMLKTPFSFDVSIREIFWPLLAGARLSVARPGGHRDPAYLTDFIRRREVTVLHFVPSMLRAFLSQDEFPGLKSLRQVTCSGEALPADLKDRFFQRMGTGIELYNRYGPTEASIGVTSCRCLPSDSERRVSIGRPNANAEIFLLDRRLQPVPIGASAQLCIGGKALARGYLNRPGLTADCFIPNPFGRQPGARLYGSGDLARYRWDGRIDFLGRADHQVKVRGFRIELEEIEAVLAQHPWVKMAAVCVIEEAAGDRRLAAYVTLPDGFTQRRKDAEEGEEAEGDWVSDLRGFLRERLAAYMVPSSFMVLEEMPLSSAGKVDRKALPEPRLLSVDEDSKVAPRTAAEALLAKIWSEVLGVESIGVEDNFFELGGDSILSIQIVAKANQAGLKLTARQAFEHQTIAELAAVAGQGRQIAAQQGIVEGDLPLTPIQRQFFERRLTDAHHWNQSVLLEVSPDLGKPGLLEQAAAQLEAHHDALRLRFVEEGSTWRQINAGLGDPSPLCRLDLSALNPAQRRSALESAAAQLQTSLDLASGPLFRLAHFSLEAGQPGRLLIAIHHLAVDGVSWRILVEDLQFLCRQLSQGQSVQLPPKTTSFQEWARRLDEHAQTQEARAEAAYWLGQKAEASVFPLDAQGPNTEASVGKSSLTLSRQETEALLQEVPQAYGTQINDALLTALVQTFSAWTGTDGLLVDLEGHGREALFEELDISRTVGWFTSIFPVWLPLRTASGPGQALQAVKEKLRSIPNRGMGFGLLRYLSRDASLAKRLSELAAPQVSFNYLGQFDQALPQSGPFRLAAESGGAARSPRAQRNHLLDVSGSIADGKLLIEFSYSRNLHRRSAIERLAQDYIQALKDLVEHCRSASERAYTPSDFPEIDISQQELDELYAQYASEDEE